MFHKVHLLDRYVDHGVPATWGRFDASPDMANSWFRLTEGSFLKIDVQLLKHELAEAWYTRVDGPGYKAAHDKASVKYPSPKY